MHIEKDVEEEFNVPAHWHERHDEIFHILEGRVEVRIGKEKRFYTPEDGEITIPRGVEHSLRVVKGEECILEEGTVPMVSLVRYVQWFGTNTYLESMIGRTKRKSCFSAMYLLEERHAVAFSVSCRSCITEMYVQCFLCTSNGSKEW